MLLFLCKLLHMYRERRLLQGVTILRADRSCGHEAHVDEDKLRLQLLVPTEYVSSTVSFMLMSIHTPTAGASLCLRSCPIRKVVLKVPIKRSPFKFCWLLVILPEGFAPPAYHFVKIPPHPLGRTYAGAGSHLSDKRAMESKL